MERKKWEGLIVLIALLSIPFVGNYSISFFGESFTNIFSATAFLTLFFILKDEKCKNLLLIGLVLGYLLEGVGTGNLLWIYSSAKMPFYAMLGWPFFLVLAFKVSEILPESFVFKNFFFAFIIVYFLVCQYLQPDLMRYLASLFVLIPFVYHEKNSLFLASLFVAGELHDFLGVFFGNWSYPVSLAGITFPFGAGVSFAVFGWFTLKLAELLAKKEG
ncbi:MAG: hypothetical protein GOU97_03010 [Nanoarchaeota archaeon]|nr:hypothetical protein [Nanoarchaeota archaeon]